MAYVITQPVLDELDGSCVDFCPSTASTRASGSATSTRPSASTAAPACPSARSTRSSCRAIAGPGVGSGQRGVLHRYAARAGHPARLARRGTVPAPRAPIRRWLRAGPGHDRGRSPAGRRRRDRRPGRRARFARAGFPPTSWSGPRIRRDRRGLQLAPNALRVLDGLGVLPELAVLGVHPGHLVFMHADTGSISPRWTSAAVRARYGYPYTVMHRGDLLTVLSRGLPGG